MVKKKLTDCKWLKLDKMRNSTLLITGGTGLVGSSIIRELFDIVDQINLKVIVLVRNEERAKRILGDYLAKISLLKGDVVDAISIEGSVDYIIHCASVTASHMFVEKPVETIMTSVLGARNLLEFAAEKHVRSMVYLSSMEVYGSPEKEDPLTEADIGYLNPLMVRSSYPESKRMCESLCVAYGKEYGVNVKIARLAQTFGLSMQSGDKRAIVQFVSNALDNEDIQIKTSGASARMYLCTFDAVTALLTIMLYGENCSAYNVADKNSYCSIAELAKQIVEIFGSSSRILLGTGTAEDRELYPPESFLLLDVSGLEKLGWQPCYTLREGLWIFGKSMQALK